MKIVIFTSALLATALLLASCGKETLTNKEIPAHTQTAKGRNIQAPPSPIVDESIEIVEAAYKSLGLAPLNIDKDNLPPIPKPWRFNVYPLDKELDDLLERIREIDKSMGPGMSGSPGYFKITNRIFWAYAKPIGIILGQVISVAGVNKDNYYYERNYKGKDYLPLTFAFEPREQYIDADDSNKRDVNPLRDSLNRIHPAIPSPKVGLPPFTPTPYDLRKMVVASGGMDISPLFCIRYENYKEAARLGDFSKAVYSDARISEMTLGDLDWIYGGFFHLFPLTTDYPNFTLICIMKDGTIFKRDLHHPL